MAKKRHHFIPQAYLNFFCDEKGKVNVYPKDEPGKSFHQAPNNVAFHKHFYAQPTPEGGVDHGSLENVFAEIESKWPPIIERLKKREDVNDALEDIFTFMLLQRARVPASRDVTEKIDAEAVRASMKVLDAAGKLPPKPEGFENLLERVVVSINPHRSIHAMVSVVQATGQIFDRLGIGVLHNVTEIPFLTSDNPVIWLDPSVPEAELRPYTIRLNGPVLLLFPVTPHLLIYGDSATKEQFAAEGISEGDLPTPESVEMINRHICRFAYKTVFAQSPGQESLIERNSSVSPVLQTTMIPGPKGRSIFHELVFGSRERKPKWNGS